MTAWLERLYRREGLRFLGHWDHFCLSWDLYKLDRLHLNRNGTNTLAGSFVSWDGFKLNWQGDGILTGSDRIFWFAKWSGTGGSDCS